MDKVYRTDIDAIKGIAIIAIIFYHIGMLPNGFLGVEAFLVINGYLIIPPLVNSLKNNEFRFIPWFTKRLFRLWPIVIFASIVCLAVGYWMMIPDSYENLAQSVVASDLFTNNILSSITTNYWDVSTEFKPLMQMWYLGVVIQFYLLFPLLLYVGKTCFKRFREKQNFWLYLVTIIGVLSFFSYLFLPDTFNNKFYFVHYRIWEFSIGGLIGLIFSNIDFHKCLIFILYVALCMLFLIGAKSISQVDTMTVIGMEKEASVDIIKIALTSCTAILTGILLLTNVKWGGVLPWLGRMSLSLFVWHQVILAFVRYGFVENLDWIQLLIYLVVVLVISYASFRLIERIKCKTVTSKAITLSAVTLCTVIAFMIYRHAGVVRDVPELGITMDNPHANRNTEYIDQIYNFQKPFSTSKPHVLIVGHSFARDFACIVKEYDIDNNLEISYSPDFKNLEEKTLADADFMFVFGAKHKVPAGVFKDLKPTCKAYGIGTKSYGKNFGIFYAKRNSPKYFDQTIEIHPIVKKLNSEWRSEWGKDNFIDIMEASRLPNGKYMIFTPDHKVISFDCRHLTQYGCKFYSTRLNLNIIFEK